ncbi:hypothetical protein HNP24_000576 [Chryseobacterium sediminis]|uniref:DUF4403 family protein n=1 Tax=Chryseobacterium sediminis TaxID=1679494 RepID=A0ABR6PVX8_9FLAO|nr:hypothetical protein [Chryseobacterium sediminis]MBB6329626.1 hypothetical protein [Chryseobacterium sediminis]
MNVQDAHQSLLAFSGQNAGIGISIELIERLINEQLQRLSGHFSQLESNQRFKNALKVTFTGDFDTTGLKFKFVNVFNPSDANEFFPQVQVGGLKLKIKGFLEQKQVVEIEVDYSEINGIIQLIDKHIKIALFNEVHNETNFIKIWENDVVLKQFFENAPYNFVLDDWNQLVVYFKATSLFSGRDIAEAFIDSLRLPDIFKTFIGIKFGENAKLGADHSGNLLMFTADSSINFNNCPTFNATGRTQVNSVSKVKNIDNVYTIGNAPKNSNLIVETTIDQSSQTLHYPVEDNIEKTETGDIFLFTPINLLRVNFDVVKPSVTASDSGSFGPVYWHYSLTAAVKSLNLELSSSWPIEFKLSLPTEVTGQAGAGIKIGCIRYEALGAMFDGQVDPFDISFKIYLDWGSKQIVFISKIEEIKGHDFNFRTFPDLSFPISNIVDSILAKASENVITEQAGKILNVTRIPIANLDLINRFATLDNTLAGASDGLGNVTMGVKFKNKLKYS